jgi:hypothetical protein
MKASQLILRIFSASLVAVVLGAGQPVGALAFLPSEDGGDVTQSLPYAVTLTSVGEGGQASTGLNVPPGLTAVELSGVITATAVSDGVVVVSVGTNQTEVPIRSGGAFTLSLPPGTMVDSTVILNTVNKLDPQNDELCSYDTTTSVTLSEISLTVSGFETAPTTVAQFFSPSVRNITVLTADSTDSQVTEAVLSAVGSLASKYGRDTLITALTTAEFLSVPGLGSRVVEIVPSTDADVRLEVSSVAVPTLTLTGPPEKLSAAAAALGSVNLGLAGQPVVGSLKQTDSGETAAVVTLADLGTAQPVLAGVGRLSYSTTVSQSRFGGPVDSFVIHLEGGNTPTPEGGIVRASVLWNDIIVDSQTIADNDTYLVDVTIDSTLVKRDNILTVRLEAVPAGGICTTGPLPAELDINGVGSTVSARSGQSLPAGFARFPQTLGTALPIAFGSGDITPVLLTAAAHLVSALQRASVPQLGIRVVDFAQFEKESYPGLVVGARPADADAVAAPLRFEPWRAVDAAGKKFTVTVDGPFGALEAFNHSGRDVLLLGSTAPLAQSEELQGILATQADADPFGWFVLTGDLLIAQSGQPTLALSSSTIVPQETTAAEYALPLWLIIAVAVLVIIVAARLIALIRRRRRIETDVDH